MLTRCAVNMQIRETAANMPNMVIPPGEQHGIGGGLRSLTAFLVMAIFHIIKLLSRNCIVSIQTILFWYFDK